MNRRIRIGVAVVTVLAAVMLAQAPAPALTYGSCSGTYSRLPASCAFTPAGPNLYVGGSSSGGYVRVRITDATGTITIAECTGTSSCFAQFGPSHTGTDSVGPPAAGPLLCQVVQGTAGNYGCASGI